MDVCTARDVLHSQGAHPDWWNDLLFSAYNSIPDKRSPTAEEEFRTLVDALDADPANFMAQSCVLDLEDSPTAEKFNSFVDLYAGSLEGFG